MGDPKFQTKKYKKPPHPWMRTRLDEERTIKKDYGFKNKKELWKAESFLRNLKTQAKILIREGTEQARKEEALFRKRLIKYGLLSEGFKLEDVLSLEPKNIFDLRLQTQVHKQGFAKTMKQARQFIVHGHILVNNQKVDIPSYFVLDNDKISFVPTSKLSNTDHPERPKEKQEVKTQLKLPEKKEEIKEAPKVEKIKEEKIEKLKEKKKEEKVPTTHELVAKKVKRETKKEIKA